MRMSNESDSDEDDDPTSSRPSTTTAAAAATATTTATSSRIRHTTRRLTRRLSRSNLVIFVVVVAVAAPVIVTVLAFVYNSRRQNYLVGGGSTMMGRWEYKAKTATGIRKKEKKEKEKNHQDDFYQKNNPVRCTKSNMEQVMAGLIKALNEDIEYNTVHDLDLVISLGNNSTSSSSSSGSSSSGSNTTTAAAKIHLPKICTDSLEFLSTNKRIVLIGESTIRMIPKYMYWLFHPAVQKRPWMMTTTTTKSTSSSSMLKSSSSSSSSTGSGNWTMTFAVRDLIDTTTNDICKQHDDGLFWCDKSMLMTNNLPLSQGLDGRPIELSSSSSSMNPKNNLREREKKQKEKKETTTIEYYGPKHGRIDWTDFATFARTEMFERLRRNTQQRHLSPPDVVIVNFGMHWFHLLNMYRAYATVPDADSIYFWTNYETEWLDQIMKLLVPMGVKIVLFKTTNRICTDKFKGKLLDLVRSFDRTNNPSYPTVIESCRQSVRTYWDNFTESLSSSLRLQEKATTATDSSSIVNRATFRGISEAINSKTIGSYGANATATATPGPILTDDQINDYCVNGTLDQNGPIHLNERLQRWVDNYNSNRNNNKDLDGRDDGGSPPSSRSTTKRRSNSRLPIVQIFNDNAIQQCSYTPNKDGRHYFQLNLPRIRLLLNQLQCIQSAFKYEMEW